MLVYGKGLDWMQDIWVFIKPDRIDKADSSGPLVFQVCGRLQGEGEAAPPLLSARMRMRLAAVQPAKCMHCCSVCSRSSGLV